MEWGVTPQHGARTASVTPQTLAVLDTASPPRDSGDVARWKQGVARQMRGCQEREQVRWGLPEGALPGSTGMRSRIDGDAAYHADAFVESLQVYGDGLAGALGDEASVHLRHVLHTNRAASHLAMGHHTLALSDAQHAVELRVSYTRAHVVKSLALLGQGSAEAAFTTLLASLAHCTPTAGEWSYIYSVLHKAQPLADTVPRCLLHLRHPHLARAPRYLAATLQHLLDLLAENDVDPAKISDDPSSEGSAAGTPVSAATRDADAVSITAENLQKLTFSGVQGRNYAGASRDPTELCSAAYADTRTLAGRLHGFHAGDGPRIVHGWKGCPALGVREHGVVEALLKVASLYDAGLGRVDEGRVVKGAVATTPPRELCASPTGVPPVRLEDCEAGADPETSPTLFEDPVLAATAGRGDACGAPARRRGSAADAEAPDDARGPYQVPQLPPRGGVGFRQASQDGEAKKQASFLFSPNHSTLPATATAAAAAAGAGAPPAAALDGWRRYVDPSGREFFLHRPTGVSARDRSAKVLAQVGRVLATREKKAAASLTRGGEVERVDDHLDDPTSLAALGWRKSEGGCGRSGSAGMGGAKSTYLTSSTRGTDELPETDEEVVAMLASGEWVVVRHVVTGLKYFYNPQTKAATKDLKAELRTARRHKAALDAAHPLPTPAYPSDAGDPTPPAAPSPHEDFGSEGFAGGAHAARPPLPPPSPREGRAAVGAAEEEGEEEVEVGASYAPPSPPQPHAPSGVPPEEPEEPGRGVAFSTADARGALLNELEEILQLGAEPAVPQRLPPADGRVEEEEEERVDVDAFTDDPAEDPILMDLIMQKDRAVEQRDVDAIPIIAAEIAERLEFLGLHTSQGDALQPGIECPAVPAGAAPPAFTDTPEVPEALQPLANQSFGVAGEGVHVGGAGRRAGKSPDPTLDELMIMKDAAMAACDYEGVVEAAQRIAQHIRQGEGEGEGQLPYQSAVRQHRHVEEHAEVEVEAEVVGPVEVDLEAEVEVEEEPVPAPQAQPHHQQQPQQLTEDVRVPAAAGGGGSALDDDPILMHLLQEREMAVGEGQLGRIGLLAAQIQDRVAFLQGEEPPVQPQPLQPAFGPLTASFGESATHARVTTPEDASWVLADDTGRAPPPPQGSGEVFIRSAEQTMTSAQSMAGLDDDSSIASMNLSARYASLRQKMNNTGGRQGMEAATQAGPDRIGNILKAHPGILGKLTPTPSNTASRQPSTATAMDTKASMLTLDDIKKGTADVLSVIRSLSTADLNSKRSGGKL